MTAFLIYLTIYFVLHSILADAGLMKSVYYKWWYRFFYVVQSVILFIPLFVMFYLLPSDPLFVQTPFLDILFGLVWILGLLFGLYAVKSYDNGAFLGLTQVKMKLRGDDYKYRKPRLTRTGALKYVRHPYYTLSLFLIWFRPLSEKDIYLNVSLTIYFILGTINEERKLKKEFGQDYIDYMKDVPALIPFIKPGRR